MNTRERFSKVLHYQPVDRIPDMDFGYWDETLEAWWEQGLPREVLGNVQAEEHFGLEGTDRIPWLPLHNGLVPGFGHTVLQDEGDTLIVRDNENNTCRVNKQGASIPQYLEYGLKTRDDWDRYKAEQLDISRPERFGDAAAVARAAHEAGMPCRFLAGSLYGWLRNWMGVEELSIALMEDPEWVGEMMEHLKNLTLTLIEKGFGDAEVDMAWWWEDMCFNNGPLCSPRLFEELMVPRYREITAALARRGVDINILDCDGRIYELVPGWLRGGINCMFPIEAAHTDPLRLREQHGPELLLVGGVNKVELAKGPAAIDAELARLEPLMRAGGFIPCVDHRVPPDVSLENYQYYLKRKRELL